MRESITETGNAWGTIERGMAELRNRLLGSVPEMPEPKVMASRVFGGLGGLR